MKRREFLALAAATALSPLAPAQAGARQLRAFEASAALAGAGHPRTKVWTYDGSVPGPVLRYRQGDHLAIEVENQLPADTTVHFHGIRLPNAMDGVPHLTQAPIAARGGRFLYEFELRDAGTFWYHPHLGSPEQVGRGLSGALIVEESAPPAVDRDLAWVLSDWRLDREARIVENFGNAMDASHAGRIGNTVTVNGTVTEALEVGAGERLRLRLVNASNARIYGLEFRGHEPWVIALDGQPVEPHRVPRVVLGPAMRADLLIDMTGEPGKSYTVVDSFYARQAYRLLDLRYSGAPRSGRAGEPLPKLAPNTLGEPDLGAAQRHRVVFGGGAMGALPPGAREHGAFWTVNGEPVVGHHMKPFLRCGLGRSYVIELVNDTAWHHPIHLHGHVFRVLSRNGQATRHREWLDTVLLDPRSRAEIAFVADNPGKWMFHCHVLEHQDTGLMALIEVG